MKSLKLQVEGEYFGELILAFANDCAPLDCYPTVDKLGTNDGQSWCVFAFVDLSRNNKRENVFANVFDVIKDIVILLQNPTHRGGADLFANFRKKIYERGAVLTLDDVAIEVAPPGRTGKGGERAQWKLESRTVPFQVHGYVTTIDVRNGRVGIKPAAGEVIPVTLPTEQANLLRSICDKSAGEIRIIPIPEIRGKPRFTTNERDAQQIVDTIAEELSKSRTSPRHALLELPLPEPPNDGEGAS